MPRKFKIGDVARVVGDDPENPHRMRKGTKVRITGYKGGAFPYEAERVHRKRGGYDFAEFKAKELAPWEA